jgi:hypothetical protein
VRHRRHFRCEGSTSRGGGVKDADFDGHGSQMICCSSLATSARTSWSSCHPHSWSAFCLASRTSKGGWGEHQDAGAQAGHFKIQDCQGGGPAWVEQPSTSEGSFISTMKFWLQAWILRSVHSCTLHASFGSQPANRGPAKRASAIAAKQLSSFACTPDHGFLAVTLYSTSML